MFILKTSLDTQTPDRLLRPAALLRSLRPLKLEAITDELRMWLNRAQAVKLARRFAPKLLAEWNLTHDWDNLFDAVLRTVEVEYPFEICWDNLDADYDAWMQDTDNDVFARWLWEIPVLFYGFSGWDESWPETYPAMALLKALIDDDWGDMILSNLIDEYDLEADWYNIALADIRNRLAAPAAFADYEPPLCWLPEMARIAGNCTGHSLLDYSNYYEDEPPSYTWDQIDQVSEAYRRAEPLIEHMREFLGWAEGPEQMQQIVAALVGERGKPKRKRSAKLNRVLARTV